LVRVDEELEELVEDWELHSNRETHGDVIEKGDLRKQFGGVDAGGLFSIDRKEEHYGVDPEGAIEASEEPVVATTRTQVSIDSRILEREPVGRVREGGAIFGEATRRLEEGREPPIHDALVARETACVERDVDGVARYKGAPAADCEFLLDRMCAWLDELSGAAEGHRWAPAMPILRAILAHLYIAWIHPFGDGNGRTARLVEFMILVQAGVPTPAAHLLSNHYNETRAEYYRQLDRASRSGGDIVPFLVYAVQGFVDGLRAQIELIREQQLDITWRNYVYERFKHIKSPGTPTNHRRRDLILDLSRKPRPEGYSPFEIRDLTPGIAREYAGKSLRTLVRDLNALAQMGLLAAAPHGFAANTDVIKAFLPRAADDGVPVVPDESDGADEEDNADAERVASARTKR